jgi:hypothetical protein
MLHYWPILFAIAGVLGLVGQATLAWVCILLAGLLALVA